MEKTEESKQAKVQSILTSQFVPKSISIHTQIYIYIYIFRKEREYIECKIMDGNNKFGDGFNEGTREKE